MIHALRHDGHMHAPAPSRQIPGTCTQRIGLRGAASATTCSCWRRCASRRYWLLCVASDREKHGQRKGGECGERTRVRHQRLSPGMVRR
jgi:hypothetical protein